MSSSRQQVATLCFVRPPKQDACAAPCRTAPHRTAPTQAHCILPRPAPPQCVCSKLYDAGLEGEIPSPNGWELPPQLTFLDLGSNKIQGSIPPGWRLPDMLEFLALVSSILFFTLGLGSMTQSHVWEDFAGLAGLRVVPGLLW